MVALDEAIEAGRAAADGSGSAPLGFGALPYSRQFTDLLPALHATFNGLNRYVGVPALRMGLGAYMSTPLTGYLMLLRTKGRKSGLRREAPLGYVVVDDAVYCTAGFGRRTHWFRNIQADPRVEVVLPGRSFSGKAEEVTDADEIRRVIRPLAESMALISRLLTGMNPRTAPEDEILRVWGSFPLVRIRATGIAAGPDDPGGFGWVVKAVAGGAATLWLLRRLGGVLR